MDDFEDWFDRGVTDGLPVVPPTRERVERMLAGTRRDRGELAGEMPPNYGRATVERVAVNAVMAGCRPEYLPVVLAAVQAACDPAFALHGMSTSTHFSAPLIVINGPIRTRIGVNCSFGVFGPGYRANATIGRALRLAMINVGGAKPGERPPCPPSAIRAATPIVSANTRSRALGPRSRWSAASKPDAVRSRCSRVRRRTGSPDHASRSARALAGSLGWSMAGLWNIKHFPLYSHTMLVVGPEHARTFADDGWSKDDLKRHLYETVRVPYRTLLPDSDNGEGTNLRFAKGPEPAPDTLVPKFPSIAELHVVVAGEPLDASPWPYSGWLGTKNGSSPVTVAVDDGL